MTATRRPSIPLLATVTLLAIVGAGCGSAGGGAGSPSGGSSAHSASTGPTAGTDDEQRHDLTDQKAVEWLRYERVSPHRLRVFFTTGDPKCYGARTVVRQSSSRVEIAVIVGVLPGAPKECTAVGRYASLIVTLDEPLGDRRVVELADPLGG